MKNNKPEPLIKIENESEEEFTNNKRPKVNNLMKIIH